MRLALGFSRGIDRLNGWVGRQIGWLVLVMVLLGSFNALARYAGRFGQVSLSSNGFIEGQWYLFSLVFLLGAGWTLQQDKHVRVDVFYGRLSPRVRAWIDLVGSVVLLLPFCVFGLVVSWGTVANSWSVLEGSPDPGGLPRYPIKTMILVSFALVALQGLSELIKRVAVLSGRLEPGALDPTAPEAPR